VPWPMPILHPSWRGLYSQFIQLCSKRIPFSERLERVGRICTGFGVRIVKYNEITRLVRDSDSRFVDPLSGKESNSVWRQLWRGINFKIWCVCKNILGLSQRRLVWNCIREKHHKCSSAIQIC
jgi:hypothetical protein